MTQNIYSTKDGPHADAHMSDSTMSSSGLAPRDLIFERSDGSQVLVTIWFGGDLPTMAERPDSSATWGPPVEAIYDSARRAEK